MKKEKRDSELLRKLGRPQKINFRGEQFLKYYLNPLLSPQDICKQLSISLATFYNYEKELDIPQVRVAIGLNTGQLPIRHALRAQIHESEKADIEIISEVAQLARMRVTLLPRDKMTQASLYSVSSKQVDFAIASVAWTKEKGEKFYFSNPYNPEVKALGVLMRLKNSSNIKIKQRGKYILGAPIGTVHGDHAIKNMSNDYEVKLLRSIPLTLQALNGYKIDFALLHPAFLEMAPDKTKNIEICSEPIVYNSFTGMLFHSDSDFLRPYINRAIDQRLENQFIKERKS